MTDAADARKRWDTDSAVVRKGHPCTVGREALWQSLIIRLEFDAGLPPIESADPGVRGRGRGRERHRRGQGHGLPDTARRRNADAMTGMLCMTCLTGLCEHGCGEHGVPAETMYDGKTLCADCARIGTRPR
jgi:hypothetical protein